MAHAGLELIGLGFWWWFRIMCYFWLAGAALLVAALPLPLAYGWTDWFIAAWWVGVFGVVAVPYLLHGRTAAARSPRVRFAYLAAWILMALVHGVGFRWYSNPSFRVLNEVWQGVPAIGVVLIVLLLWLRQQPATYVAGHCRACGYDLAGNRSGVCPECGRHVDATGPHAPRDPADPPPPPLRDLYDFW